MLQHAARRLVSQVRRWDLRRDIRSLAHVPTTALDPFVLQDLGENVERSPHSLCHATRLESSVLYIGAHSDPT